MRHSDSPETFLARRNPVPRPEDVVDETARARIYASVTADVPPRPPVARSARRLTPRRVVAGATGFAIVVVGALLIGGGTPDTSFPAAVAKLADQAMDPGAVVHTVVTGDDVEGADGASRETWATVDGSVQRYRTTQPGGDYTDTLLRVDGRRVTLTVYRSANNTLYRYPTADRPPVPGVDASQLSITGISDYASAIRAGNAHIAGETTVDGIPAYRVVQKGPSERPEDTQTWIVSKDSAQPRLLQIQRPCPKDAAPCPATTFRAYDIRDDRSTLGLPAYPDARVVDVAPPPEG